MGGTYSKAISRESFMRPTIFPGSLLLAIAFITSVILAEGEEAPKAEKKAVEAKYKEVKVTITGTVKDEDGNALKDVTVFVFAQNYGFNNLDVELRECRQIAKTESRENGSYELRDVAIKILDNPDPLVIGAGLELLALCKDGKAAWRGACMLVRNAEEASFTRNAIAPGKSTVIDIDFRPMKPITGRVIDEADRPIANAQVRLISCWPSPRQFPAKSLEGESLSFSLQGKRHAAPESVAARKSDAEGRFEFGNIPVDMRATFIASHPDFSMVWLGATNAEDELQGEKLDGDLKFQRGEVKIRLRKTYPVPVEVKLAGSGKPAAGAMVAASEVSPADKLSGATGMEFANEKGVATLRLPAGKFKVHSAYEGTPSADVITTEISVDATPRTAPLLLQAAPRVQRDAP
jgi:hypothetical protein